MCCDACKASVGQTPDPGFNNNSATTTPYVIEAVFNDVLTNSNERFDIVTLVAVQTFASAVVYDYKSLLLNEED